MLVLMVTLLGIYATRLSYNLSVERGRHRRKKRGLWDYAAGKIRNDAVEEYDRLMTGWEVTKWTGATRRYGSSLLA
jgi:hypothetical protein